MRSPRHILPLPPPMLLLAPPPLRPRISEVISARVSNSTPRMSTHGCSRRPSSTPLMTGSVSNQLISRNARPQPPSVSGGDSLVVAGQQDTGAFAQDACPRRLGSRLQTHRDAEATRVGDARCLRRCSWLGGWRWSSGLGGRPASISGSNWLGGRGRLAGGG